MDTDKNSCLTDLLIIFYDCYSVIMYSERWSAVAKQVIGFEIFLIFSHQRMIFKTICRTDVIMLRIIQWKLYKWCVPFSEWYFVSNYRANNIICTFCIETSGSCVPLAHLTSFSAVASSRFTDCLHRARRSVYYQDFKVNSTLKMTININQLSVIYQDWKYTAARLSGCITKVNALDPFQSACNCYAIFRWMQRSGFGARFGKHQ